MFPRCRKGVRFGYAKREGFAAVSLPYAGNDLQFLVLFPDDVNGLRALESKLSGDVLAECAKLGRAGRRSSFAKVQTRTAYDGPRRKVQALGMKSAFDNPQGSANFDKMAQRKPKDYLYISQIFHKTFIAVDEKGTEAAAATAVAMMAATAIAMAKTTANRSESRSPIHLCNSTRPERRVSFSRARNESSLIKEGRSPDRPRRTGDRRSLVSYAA